MSIYLYIKTHQKTGLKYFGKTTSKDPYKYRGSGKYWSNHLKKHGNHVDTEVLGCYTEDEVEEIALKFSKDNNIVESNDWANLIEENGFDGVTKGTSLSENHKAKIGDALKGKNTKPKSENHKAKIGDALKGRKLKPLPEETKIKMSIAHKGKSLSDEHRLKISLAMEGKKRGPYKKRSKV